VTRHLLIHIGMPKCGSTYLQRVLLQNRQVLAEHGVSYSRGHLAPDHSHPGNAAGLEEADAALLETLFDGHDQLILSHEDLFSRGGKAQPLAQAARDLGVSVDILAFIRPLSEFVYGDYSQNMKQKFPKFLAERCAYDGLDFEGFAARRATTLKPALRFDQWRKAFRGQGFHLHSHKDIRPVIDARYPGMDLNWTVPRFKANPSLRMVDCEALARKINGRFLSPGYIKLIYKAALKASVELADDPGRTSARTITLEALFAPQNAALLDSFGYDNRHPLVMD